MAGEKLFLIKGKVMTYKDIAQRTGLAVLGVKKRLERAQQRGWPLESVFNEEMWKQGGPKRHKTKYGLLTATQIARRAGISPATVRVRLRKLRERGLALNLVFDKDFWSVGRKNRWQASGRGCDVRAWTARDIRENTCYKRSGTKDFWLGDRSVL